MPRPETSHRKQKAMFWEASGTDTYGEHKVNAPVEISVRWDQTQTEGQDAQGNTITISASVHVGQMLPVGSIIWLGERNDLPSTLVDLHKVVNMKRVSDVKGRRERLEASLVRHHNELPELNA